MFAKFFKKATQGKALVRTGSGGLKVSFNKMMVLPVFHKLEIMDISLKSFTISRTGKDGLICQDNLRADIKVVFFIRVNHKEDEVKKVAQSIGCARASDVNLLQNLFEPKFSEALKTVGKRFDFVDLYDKRNEFKSQMLEVIGKDLNGYVLDTASIDFLEQTPLDSLNENNILDAEGIKKITEITARERKLADKIRNEEKAVLGQQHADAREKELFYAEQVAVKEAEQQTKIKTKQDREEAERIKVAEEMARDNMQQQKKTELEQQLVEEENARQKMRAVKGREKEEVKEIEDVKKQQELAQNLRLEEVEKAQIGKEKILEKERKEIQDLIRQRVEVEVETVKEEEKIKDTRAHAAVERNNQVAMKQRENEAEVALVEQIKAAEAAKRSAELKTQQDELEAQTRYKVTQQDAESKKLMADAQAEESASLGLAEARVMEAKAKAMEDQGVTEANIIEKKAVAEAKGIEAQKAAENAAFEEQSNIEARLLEEKGKIEARVLEEKGIAEAKILEIRAEADKKQALAIAESEKAKGLAQAEVEEAMAEAQKKKGLTEADVLIAQAEAEKTKGFVEAQVAEAKAESIRKQGLAEAEAMEAKALVEAKKIAANADAMQKMDGVGREREEFRLQLEKDTKVELANVEVQKAIAEAQAMAMAEALKNSKIDIVGGETMFYENIMNVIRRGKTIDTFVNGSQTISELKGALLNGEGASLLGKLRDYIADMKISAKDIKDLSISALILKMSGMTQNNATQTTLKGLLDMAKKIGLADENASKFL
ncbi:conserved hypothetical protein [Microscilla marina ATCC 23134]|uniref:Uncharacterized protein n=2 Tax=Microscilla marina TaxID=1027 RepID=A1ZGY3_MICM2|nr:conserved hypothetical protein [Microscilla marina ATCC 23134]